jgi:uncharacterized protein
MSPVDSITAAFTAGLVTSLHCVGMCGPLACSSQKIGIYHTARLTAYGIVGALAGWLGTLPAWWLQQRGVAVLPWLLVIVLALVGMGLDAWLPKPAFLSLPMARLRLGITKLGARSRAAVLGLATPLLPCGPLYLMFGMAMANGSASSGAEFSIAFGLGTLPLLAMAQMGLQRAGIHFSPIAMRRLQRGLALVAAVTLAWRLRGTLFGGAGGCSCEV